MNAYLCPGGNSIGADHDRPLQTYALYIAILGELGLVALAVTQQLKH